MSTIKMSILKMMILKNEVKTIKTQISEKNNLVSNNKSIQTEKNIIGGH